MKSFVCPDSCCVTTHRSLRRLIQHLKYCHANVVPFTCGISNCVKPVRNVLAFERHCRRDHHHLLANITGPPVLSNSCVTNTNDVSDAITTGIIWESEGIADDMNNLDDDHDDDSSSDDDSETDDLTDDINDVTAEKKDVSLEDTVNFEEEVASFLLKSREKHKLSTSATQYVASSFENLLNHHSKLLLTKMDRFFKEDLGNADKISIESIFFQSPLNFALEKFSIDKALDRYASASPDFVHSDEIFLGYSPRGKKESYQYIPIHKTLISILPHDDVLAEIFQPCSSADGFIRCARDGDYFRNHPYFSDGQENKLMVNLYNDEFVVSNPLGNKTRKSKILAFYFTLGNFSNKLNSKVENIFLAVLSLSKYVQKYSVERVLAPLIEDLKALEFDGVSVKYKNRTMHFCGTVFLILSDNLAAHWLGGFQENFSTTKRICRFCMCLRNEIGEILHNDDCVLRTPASFNQHVQFAGIGDEYIKEYGVKADCPFNELQYFHCVTGIPFDAAHDFLEGVIPYILSSLVAKLVEKNFLTLEDFNRVIETFEYSRLDKKDLPQTQKIDCSLANFRIKLTAGECWVFVRLFPLMFGPFVPEDEEIWRVVRLLSCYFQLLMSFEFHPGMTERMDSTLQCLYGEVLLQLPQCGIKPKFHFGIHYGLQTRLFGPPRFRFTLRYESKHMAIKQPLSSSKNRKNVCFTLAHRHQTQMHLRCKEENFFPRRKVTPVNLKQVHIKCLRYDLQTMLPPTESPIISISTGVSLNDGSFYEQDVVLHTDEEHKVDLFLQVVQIVFSCGEPYLFCEELLAVDFDQHYHAYLVKKQGVYRLIHIHGLQTSNIHGLYVIDGKSYVPPKFEMNILL